jgi:hypothetical protein
MLQHLTERVKEAHADVCYAYADVCYADVCDAAALDRSRERGVRRSRRTRVRCRFCSFPAVRASVFRCYVCWRMLHALGAQGAREYTVGFVRFQPSAHPYSGATYADACSRRLTSADAC